MSTGGTRIECLEIDSVDCSTAGRVQAKLPVFAYIHVGFWKGDKCKHESAEKLLLFILFDLGLGLAFENMQITSDLNLRHPHPIVAQGVIFVTVQFIAILMWRDPKPSNNKYAWLRYPYRWLVFVYLLDQFIIQTRKWPIPLFPSNLKMCTDLQFNLM